MSTCVSKRIGLYNTGRWQGLRVGLLGGSFNPAHEGHRHISLTAMQKLGLDAVWWLVSPQNPLKSTQGMASQQRRLESAAITANHLRIFVTDIEKDLGTQYTVDTIRALQSRFSQTRFVWLMGSDNLHQFHRWKKSDQIFDLIPICVLSRPPFGDTLRSTVTGNKQSAFLYRQEDAAAIMQAPHLPAWTIIRMPLNQLSSTSLRQAGKWE